MSSEKNPADSNEKKPADSSQALLLLGIMALLPLMAVTKGILFTGEDDSGSDSPYAPTYGEPAQVQEVLPETYTKMTLPPTK